MEPYALADPNVDTLAETKGETLQPDTSDAKAKALLDKRANTLAQAEVKRVLMWRLKQ